MEHYVKECREIKDWFVDLRKDKEEIINKIWTENLKGSKGKVLRRL